MGTPAALPHRDAVLAALEGAGLVVGDGMAPPERDRPSSGGFAVLYFAAGQSIAESIADQRTDWSGLAQVTCVGPTPEVALWVADRARTALHEPLSVPGRALWRAQPLSDAPLLRDDDVTPPLFYLPLQFQLRSTSAS